MNFRFGCVGRCMDFLSHLSRFCPVPLLGRFSDSRPAIIASVSLERAHRLCCFCLSWSSASPRDMRGACPVFRLSRHRAQLSNPNCSLTGRQICPNRCPALYVVHQTYLPSLGLGVLDWSSSPRLQRGPSR